MNEILRKQLSLDYCCTESNVEDAENHFTVYVPQEGRRRFREDRECFLKVAVVNGKLLFSGSQEITTRCRELYRDTGGEWFCEAAELRKLDDLLREYGFRIKFAHPFFIADKPSEHPPAADGFDIKWYEQSDIEQFRGVDGMDEAFAFYEDAPDVLGIGAVIGDKIVGMAGASCDSPAMWQIGINVDPTARKKHIGTILVSLLKDEILRRGRLPFYGTAMSHIASQRVALGAGFLPAWAEISTTRLS